MEVFQGVKITKPEAFRIAAVDLALKLHNWRSDLVVDADKIVEDAKRINNYLENAS